MLCIGTCVAFGWAQYDNRRKFGLIMRNTGTTKTWKYKTKLVAFAGAIVASVAFGGFGTLAAPAPASADERTHDIVCNGEQKLNQSGIPKASDQKAWVTVQPELFEYIGGCNISHHQNQQRYKYLCFHHLYSSTD